MDPLSLIMGPIITTAIGALLGGGTKQPQPVQPPYQRRRPFNAPIPAPSSLMGSSVGSLYKPFTAPGFSDDENERLMGIQAMLARRR